MRYKQLSIRLPVAAYNKIQRQAVVQNASMNQVFNTILESHLTSENVILETRRTAALIADILIEAFPQEKRPSINLIKTTILEVQNGKQI